MGTAERGAVLDVFTNGVRLRDGMRRLHHEALLQGQTRAEADSALRENLDAASALVAGALMGALQRLIDVETRELVEQLLLVREGRLPCGHRRRELVAGDQVITHCRACRAEGRTWR